jgi:hypothetical protein
MLKVLPGWVREEQENLQSFIEYLSAKALIKMQEFKKKEEVYKSKYKVEFEDFEKSVLSNEKESFTLWDDYIEWKAFHAAHTMWEARYMSISNA